MGLGAVPAAALPLLAASLCSPPVPLFSDSCIILLSPEALLLDGPPSLSASAMGFSMLMASADPGEFP